MEGYQDIRISDELHKQLSALARLLDLEFDVLVEQILCMYMMGAKMEAEKRTQMNIGEPV